METILLVEDLESLAGVLSLALEGAGFQVLLAKDGVEGIAKVRKGGVDLVVTDLKLPKKSGLDVLRAVKEQTPEIPVILMTAHGSIETAVKAVKEGAYDFIAKPFDPDHLMLQIEKALEKKRLLTENLILKENLTGQIGFPKIIGKGKLISDATEKMRKVAQGKTTVLLLGESGTGKELFARALHLLSPRHDKPLVSINCAAIPKDLLESELFGHERGAFTGAVGRKIGRFELADKGTLFLDEVGELDITLQAKLLRVLEEGEVMRVGGVTNVKSDVRLIAATNRDLLARVARKEFREDLYYRLNVFSIVIPPLRERREDLPALIDHFIVQIAKALKKEVRGVSPEAMKILSAHPFTGNVRELQNAIERAIILCEGNLLLPQDLGLTPSNFQSEEIFLAGGLADASGAAVRSVESKMIQKVLSECGGNKSRAAEKLQVSYKTLLTKIKEYQIDGGSKMKRF
ncbi:MAG: sigma-54-dependent Fis family transcriptional regulator [Nitrospirae bacterium]|nr:sigma-54-dependent Fis family transcriptional regulator [Candidatus Troglogloeales bacterium]